MAKESKKQISYLGKDFSGFRKNLIDFTRQYFPNTYNDFNESSPGMMFMEMSSYVGDVLSYYADDSLKESLGAFAQENKNILAHAYTLGYKPKNIIASSVNLDLFQLVPAITSGDDIVPDYRYALIVKEDMVVKSDSTDSEFRTLNPVDFAFSSSIDPTEVSVYSINDVTNEPEFFLLKKQVKSTSGKIYSTTYDFTTPKIYDKINIQDDNIIEIVDIYDDENNKWYEVDYLAQDTVFESVQNTAKIDPELSQYRDNVPYLLKLRKTARRFITKYTQRGTLEIQFGAGISDNADEELIPNPDLIGTALPGRDREIDITLDPSNFLYTKTYGLAPANTTLTVRYTVGSGVGDNVPANDLTKISNLRVDINETGLDDVLVRQIKASVATTNQLAAFGGKNKEDDNEIRNNMLANFAGQNRAVHLEDYIIRAYSLPPRFGSIAKAFIIQDDQLTGAINSNERIANPLALNLYLLGYDVDGKLTNLNPAIKENVKTYINQYRMLTDGVNIKDAYIVNIGIDFEIIPLPEYNSNEVVLKCVDKLKSLMNVNKWQINEPIYLKKLEVALDEIDGVQTVNKLEIANKINTNEGYSGIIYDLKEATRNNVIYPSLDPVIFEVKYPLSDIRGRAISS